jgi:hypothetical protein
MGGVTPREDVHGSPTRGRFLSGARDQNKSVRKQSNERKKGSFP